MPWREANGTVHLADGRVLENTRPGYKKPKDKSIREMVSGSNIILGYERRGTFTLNHGNPHLILALIMNLSLNLSLILNITAKANSLRISKPLTVPL